MLGLLHRAMHTVMRNESKNAVSAVEKLKLSAVSPDCDCHCIPNTRPVLLVYAVWVRLMRSLYPATNAPHGHVLPHDSRAVAGAIVGLLIAAAY